MGKALMGSEVTAATSLSGRRSLWKWAGRGTQPVTSAGAVQSGAVLKSQVSRLRVPASVGQTRRSLALDAGWSANVGFHRSEARGLALGAGGRTGKKDKKQKLPAPFAHRLKPMWETFESDPDEIVMFNGSHHPILLQS
ncbi:hypothetical protein Q5P01_011909 [Channa striata]|uniref:Uncharacterized protein n=1 Tax=Channa striata TaxID=64152 RepID=A0AA88MRE1_CHASR|nr:hypothetical protein Q5P01_011909 [Channa striata]